MKKIFLIASIIASSGNVGWSSEPHLHFVYFAPAFEKRKTLETKFKIDDGKKVVLLKEGEIYTKLY